MDIIECAHTERVTDQVFSKERWNTSVMRQELKLESCDDTGFLCNAVHEQIYRLAGRHFDIFDFGRKQRILTGQNHRAGSWPNGIQLPLCLISLNTNAIWTHKRLRDDSARDDRPTDENRMGVCLDLFRWCFNILTITRRAQRACLRSNDVIERHWREA